jgi:HSP20 family molecular chaperone IbpA
LSESIKSLREQKGFHMRETINFIRVNNSKTPEETARRIRMELRNDLGEWMTAKEDLVRRPPVELMNQGNSFVARAILTDVDPDDVEVLVSPEVMLIKGEVSRILASIKFPRAVNPDKVRAWMRDGMLTVRVDVAAAKPIVFLPLAA